MANKVMRKSWLFFAVFTLLFFLSLHLEGANNSFSVVSSGANFTEVEFQLEDYELIPSRVNDINYQRIFHPEAEPSLEEGLPEIPIFTFSVAVPNKGLISLKSVNIVDSKTVSGIKIFPSQGPDLTISTERGLAINEQFYKKNTLYPNNVAVMGEPAVMRDYRYITVNVTPFRYNPSREELDISSKIKFRLEYDTSKEGVNELTNPPRKLSRSFENLYRATFLNYDEVRDDSREYQRRSILIVHNHSSSFTLGTTKFAEWKRQKGFEVAIIDTRTYQTTNAIKGYIQNAYDNWENPPEYVVIIGSGESGGSTTVPFFWGHEDNKLITPGDHPYTLLSGNDNISDIFIGRLSVQNTDQLMTIWNKITNYEKTPYVTNSSWYNNAILAGSGDKWGVSTVYLNKYIKEIMVERKKDYNFTEIWDSPYTAVNDALNSGSFLLNFRGYYQLEGWSWTGSVTTGYKLPYSFFITCHTYYPLNGSRAENFVRGGTPTVPNGGVATIGMTADDTRTAFNNALNSAFLEGIFVHNMRTMGESLVHGKTHLHRVYDVMHPEFPPRFSHWANLVGDPSMDLWVEKPKNINVQYPNTLPTGSSSIAVTVTQENGAPLKDAWVTASMPGDVIFASDYTDEYGKVVLYFDSTNIVDEVNLVVTKPDYKPHIGKFQLTEVSAVSIKDVVWTKEPAASENGMASLILKNHTNQDIHNVSANLTIESKYITVLNGSSAYGTIPSKGFKEGDVDFTLELSPLTPSGYKTSGLLTIKDGSGATWESRFEIVVQNANLEIVSYIIDSTENGVVKQGTSSFLSFKVKNTGKVSVKNLTATLRGNYGIAVANKDSDFGTIASGETVLNTTPFSIDVSQNLLSGMAPELEIHFFNEDGFSQTKKYKLPIGKVTVDDPVGPDGYGYWVYDSGDGAYAKAPVYDWQEIVPENGGKGATLNIEADYNNKHDIKVVNLPFTFKFYGREFNQATICANGWIALGVTEQATFRNWRLPGPLGPRPIIAAFWDNLKVISSSSRGVFAYYDLENHTYIVQWEQTEVFGLNSPNTFQVILYDPAYYITDTGDGPIKIQYKVFNNTNNQPSVSHQNYGNCGNYCTVGIADHSGLFGTEYTFANQYPPGGRTIQNGTAIYFTTSAPSQPFLHYDSFLVSDSELNLPVYGQSNDFYLNLKNLGDETATEITAKITTKDRYVTITHDAITFPEIKPNEVVKSSNPFTITLTDNIPYDQNIEFELEISANYDRHWKQRFKMPVSAPYIGTNTPIFHDPAPGGNGNGVLDPGETVTIYLPLKNYGAHDSGDFNITVTSPDPRFVINSVGRTNFTKIKSGETSYLTINATASQFLTDTTSLKLDHKITMDNYVFENSTLLSVGPIAYVRLGYGDMVSTTSAHSPINVSSKSSRDQIVFTPEEIRDSGFFGNLPIVQFGYFVASPPKFVLPNFLIRMRNTRYNNAKDHDTGPFTEVYSVEQYMPSSNKWDMLSLSQPFYWNGKESLLIDTSFSLTQGFDALGSGRVKIYTVKDEYRYSESNTVSQLNAVTTETSMNKPQVMLGLDTTTGIMGVAVPKNTTASLAVNAIKVSWDEPTLITERKIGSFSKQSSDFLEKSNIRGLDGYNVYRNGLKINSEIISEPFYSDSAVVQGGEYFYYVTAVYDEGESFPSNIVSTTATFIAGDPVFTPQPGVYYEPVRITVKTNPDAAVIYYTVDGSEPTQTSTKYEQPITVDYETVFKAKSFLEGIQDSEIVTAEYYILYPIENFSADTSDNKAIFSWNAPWKPESVTNPQSLLGYNVYRATDEEGSEPILLNAEPVTSTHYTDQKIEPGDYEYFVKAVYKQGESQPSETLYLTIGGVSVQEEHLIPTVTELLNAYPNPFNPSTTISFNLNEPEFVTIEIFNISGKRVKTLVKEKLSAGRHKVVWNGESDYGNKLSSGIYFYRMKGSNYQSTKKIIMLK